MKSFHLLLFFLFIMFFPHMSSAQQVKSLETFNSDHVSIIDIVNPTKVWVGTNNAGCGVYAAGVWTTFDSTNTPMESDEVTAICLYSIGGVLHSFMGTAHGVFYKYGTAWDSLTALPDMYVIGIVKSLNDSLWVSTGAGVSLYSGTALQHLADYTVFNSNLPDSTISCLQSNISNSLGYAAGTPADGFFYTLDGISYTHTTVASGGLVDDHVNCIFTAAGGGTYYIGTVGGLSVCSSGCTNYTTTNGLPDNDITALTMDCENRLWIGTRTGGLSIYNGSTFQTIDTSNGLPTNQITSISCDTTCHCWVGTNNNGIIIIDSSLTQQDTVNLPTGIVNLKTDGSVHIYPQPAATQVTFSLPAATGQLLLSVTDMAGRILLSQEIATPQQLINIEDIESGLYLYNISKAGTPIYKGKLLIAH
jgi:ligand-binding sensor domain-containing protein